MWKFILFAGVLWFGLIENALSQHTDGEKEVLQVVERLFEGMYQADSAAVADILHESGTIISRRYSDTGEVELTFTANESINDRIGSWNEKSIRERFWDAKVMIDDGIAMVWAPYDVHVDGTFSHCGIDLFSMVKTPEGWKVASITYNVKEKPCKAPAMDEE